MRHPNKGKIMTDCPKEIKDLVARFGEHIEEYKSGTREED
jgi:hypothetical protein